MKGKVLRNLFVIMALAALSLPAMAQPKDRRAGSRDDRQITVEVNKKLQDDAKLRDVRATVDDGLVTLSGHVTRYAYKEKAEKKARKVQHVSGVRNLIAVRTASVSDAELFDRLARQLVYDGFGRSNTFNYLALDVRDGVVTVRGQVRDEYAHKSALDIVRNQEGVRGVVDRVQVSAASGYDERLRFSIARAIYGDPVLRRYALDPSAPIRIVVDRGHVALYGVVSNRMDSQVAETRAREVGGSFSVENHLLVTSEMPH
jgi:osmotically-inducible protein OsmY